MAQLMVNGVCGLPGANVQRLVGRDNHRDTGTARKTNLEERIVQEIHSSERIVTIFLALVSNK